VHVEERDVIFHGIGRSLIYVCFFILTIKDGFRDFNTDSVN